MKRLVWQEDAIKKAKGNRKLLIWAKTGAGKTHAALMIMSSRTTQVSVIAPPTTHSGWRETAAEYGVELELMSIEKFRQEKVRLKYKDFIVDECHMICNPSSVGAKKLINYCNSKDRTLTDNVIFMSGTARYNKPHNLYTLERCLWLERTKGGLIEWLYKNCEVSANRFSMIPNFEAWKCGSEEAYIKTLPCCIRVPDETDYDKLIKNINIKIKKDKQIETLEKYNLLIGGG